MAATQEPHVTMPREETGRFAGLLIAQLFFIGATPWVEADRGANWILTVGVFGIILAGIYVASARRGLLITSVVLLLPTIAAWLGPDLLTEQTDELLRLTTATACFAFSAIVVTRAVYAHQTVTLDTILGGINVYLLMGFTFQMLHATIMLTDPASYSISGQYLTSYLNADEDIHSFATLLYFSFTTLTTLGYGDILPTSTVARLTTSIEAIFGQLFVAIFIGRLVALEVGRHTAIRAASRAEKHDD